MAVTISALLGEKNNAAQMAAFFSEPIAAILFGAALILLANPISRAMVGHDERVELSGLVTSDLMLVGICIVSLYFVFRIFPNLLEQLVLLHGAKNLQGLVSRIAFNLLQLCLVAIVLIRRREISEWFGQKQ